MPDRVNTGGLMRCCLATLDDQPDGAAEGETVPCKYCSASMIFRDGAWNWNRDLT